MPSRRRLTWARPLPAIRPRRRPSAPCDAQGRAVNAGNVSTGNPSASLTLQIGSETVTVSQATLELGVPVSYDANSITFAFNTPLTGFEIPAALLEGDGPAFLKIFLLHGEGGLNYFWTSSSDGASDFGAGAGPDMSAAWSMYASAITGPKPWC